jgi:ribose transport system substrate-binding protein
MMKWVYKIAYGLLFTVTILAAAGSLYYYSRVNDNTNEESAYEFRYFPNYYFSLILNTEDDIYRKDFKDGATDAAKRFNIAIEINEVSEPESQTSIVEYIHIARQSKMDGIIVAGKSSDEYNAAIREATESGINVVVGNYDASGSNRVTYVGTNYYEYGVDAAELIAKLRTSDSPIDLAIILSREYKEENTIDPVTQVITNGMSEGPINLASTLYGTSELLGAEDQIRNTLSEHPDIDVILCTNAKDTVSAANVIRERNLVGKVFIVGTDVTDQIIDYIKRGVIFGVLDRDGYSAGYQSVRMLNDSMGTTFPTNYQDVNINTYTAENISSYVKP